jgi:hypothetical protein
MENRDRDKISKGTESTPAGDVNRSTSSNIGSQKSGSSADFGKKVGRDENIENESEQGSRRSGSIGSSGMQSDSGRSSGSSKLGSESDVSKSNRGGSSDESI